MIQLFHLLTNMSSCLFTILKSSHRMSSVKKPVLKNVAIFRGGSRAGAPSKMGRFVIIVNGRKPLTIITKRSVLDVAAALDPSLIFTGKHPCWSLKHRRFPVNITKFLRESILKNICQRLILKLPSLVVGGHLEFQAKP